MDIYSVELCAGSGMLAEGIRIALGGNLRTVAYVERESYAAATLASRMADKALDSAPIWDDVHTLTSPEFMRVVGGFRPLILSGGYPCQPFSCAGKRGGESDPRHLWPSIARFIRQAEPDVCFFENVSGHLSLGFDAVARDLQGMGYRVAAGLFTAAEVGAAHRRERLFILAVRSGVILDDAAGRYSGLTAQWERGSAESTVPRMADADPSDRRRENTRRRTVGRTAAERAGGAMADTGLSRLQGSTERGCYDAQGRETAGQLGRFCGQRLFAPGPTAREWPEILAADASLKPAICRVADGLATGLDADRLRLTGNGVVPLAAAYAFVSLWAALHSGDPCLN